MGDLIKKELEGMIGKKIIVFFKYATISYNIRKSGKLIACDDTHFVLDERDDGRSTYSYNFITQVLEDKDEK